MSGAHTELTRHFHATPEALFGAWTRPELMRQWYAPNPAMDVVVEGEPREGADYRVTMGGEYTVRGTYQTVDPPRLLEFTWIWDHEPDVQSRVRVEIDQTTDGTTRLRLQHHDLAHDEDARGHLEGWDLSLNRLVVLLAT